MVDISYSEGFIKTIKKIKDITSKERIKKQILKIIESPDAGKLMMYSRKGTREVYIPPYRLSYAHIPEEDKIILLELYHKDEQ